MSDNNSSPHFKNKLYYGDCLDVMRELPPESIDLIYLDPPFNSNKAYNAIYKLETGRPLPDQVEAFCDTWELTAEREQQIQEFKSKQLGQRIGRLMSMWDESLRGDNDKLVAYLFYMAERLLVMRNLLKPTGSIYFHCDPTASHYIKTILDAVFGSKNFRNEIIWRRGNVVKHGSGFQFPRNHDVIFFYAKHKEKQSPLTDMPMRPYKDNTLKQYRYDDKDGRGPYRHQELRTYGEETIAEFEKDGRIFTDPSSGKKHLKQYLKDKEGVRVDSIWIDIPSLEGSKERLGYPTQKPLALLERIIKASSHEGDMVLDPFCGCATTLAAANNLNRRWLGVDIAIHAIKRVARVRLQERCKLIKGEDFIIEGIPRNIEGARDLWKRDHYQFQKWAVEQVDGFVTERKTGDRGIDGRIYFKLQGEKNFSAMVLEVKGGANVNVSAVRDLRGVMEREHDSVMAGLIVLEDLSERKKANFTREMAEAGQLKDGTRKYNKMQLLSVREILEGKFFNTPYVEGRGSGQGVLSSSS